MALGAGVTIAATPASMPMRADAERLSQVIINLLANAVRFSPRGGTITLTWHQRDGRVMILVDDQGPGVPPAYRHSIFEPFKQVEGSAAHKKGGTGLGLAISHAIVQKHGGAIDVADAPGGGARFIVDLPVRS